MEVKNQTAVKTSECAKCGAEIRAGSQFCYGCGTPLTEEAAEIARKLASSSNVEPPSVKTTGLRNGTGTAGESGTPRKTLRTAATMRQRERAQIGLDIPVVWVESGRSPLLYVIAAVFFALLTIFVLLAAFYLN